MVSTRPVISKSSSPCANHSVNVPRAPITIGIIVTFMFLSFSYSLVRSTCLSFFSHSFNFPLWLAGTLKSTILQVLFFFFFFFLVTIKRSDRLSEIWRSICISKSQRSLCVSFSRIDYGLCIYNFLHNSKWITLSTQSCLFLYSFCANLLYSLIMWLIVSSLLPHNLYLLFCSVLFILALIWLFLMTLFCAAIRRDSVSLLTFLFLSHVQVFS